jgi:hypothetical protein
MDFDRLLNIVGQAAIVVSLAFVGFQMQQDQDISESETLAFEAELELSFSELVSQYPLAWMKGLAGDDLTDAEYVQFDAIAYTLFRIHANRSRRGLVFSGRTVGSVFVDDLNAETFAYFIHENKGFKAWYEKMVRARVERAVAFGRSAEIYGYPATLTEYLERLESDYPDLDQKAERRLQTY